MTEERVHDGALELGSQSRSKKLCGRNAVQLSAPASGFPSLETLAERLAEMIRSDFGVPWVRVRVRKPGAVRFSREVGIEIERGSRDGREDA